jgi:hypothetical protein
MREDKLPPPVGAGVALAAALAVALPLAVAVAIALLEPPPAAAVCVLVLLDEGCPGVLLGVMLAALEVGEGLTRRAQEPAVLAVTPPVLQHVQAVQVDPSCKVLKAQQQPPKHSFVPQSKSELQGSPGE